MSNTKHELEVLGNNILLVQEEQKETVGGIILTKKSVSEEVKLIGYISVVGPDVKNPDLKEGTYVVIPRHTGRWVPFDGFKYALVSEDDILCIIDGVVRKDE